MVNIAKPCLAQLNNIKFGRIITINQPTPTYPQLKLLHCKGLSEGHAKANQTNLPI